VSISTIFFDLDDTLYPASSGLWPLIAERISLFMLERLKIPAGEVQPLRHKLFEEYGTTLRGLQLNYDFDVADFLAFVHDVPLADYIRPDPLLQTVLQNLSARKFIFTNADVNHARRVLRVLQIEQYFDGIVDVVALNPYCKPMPHSFKIALEAAGEPDPRRCAIIDDIPRTTRAAREQGLFAILYGKPEPHPDADAALADWSRLPELLNARN
jgi:pyrimidine 5'-nucleotidase